MVTDEEMARFEARMEGVREATKIFRGEIDRAWERGFDDGRAGVLVIFLIGAAGGALVASIVAWII